MKRSWLSLYPNSGEIILNNNKITLVKSIDSGVSHHVITNIINNSLSGYNQKGGKYIINNLEKNKNNEKIIIKKYNLESKNIKDAFNELMNQKINTKMNILLFAIKYKNKYYIKYFSK